MSLLPDLPLGISMRSYAVAFWFKVPTFFCLLWHSLSYPRPCAGVSSSYSSPLSGGRKNSAGDQRQWDWRGPALSSDVQLHELSSDAEEGSQTVC